MVAEFPKFYLQLILFHSTILKMYKHGREFLDEGCLYPRERVPKTQGIIHLNIHIVFLLNTYIVYEFMAYFKYSTSQIKTD